MLGQIDKYIILRLLKVFFFILLILALLIASIDVTDKLNDYIEHNVAFGKVAKYYQTFMLFVITTSMPLIVFLNTVFVTSRLANHTEIIAMFGAGLTFKRLLLPFVLVGILLAGFNFLLIGWWVPSQNSYRVDFEQKYIKNPFYYKERHVYIRVSDYSVLYLWRYESATQTAYNISLDSVKDNVLLTRVRSTSMKWDSLSQQWRLLDWSIRRFHPTADIIVSGAKKDTTLALSPNDFNNDYGLKEILSINELNDHIRYLDARGINSNPYEVEKLARYMQPFALILLTIMGVVISAKRVREGTAWRMFISFILVFVYIIFYVLVKSMAEVGSLPPIIAVWIPNIVFGFISLVFFLRLSL